VAIPESGGPAATELVAIELTDNAGRFRLADVPPGRYYIVAGLIELPTYYPGVREMKDATGISVGANTVVTLDFKMAVQNGFTVSGRVVGRDDRPLPQKLTVVLGDPGKSRGIGVAPNGSFEFTSVLPGTYLLTTVTDGFYQGRAVRVVDQDITGLEILLPTVRKN
jgi:hypothetical protein